MDYFAGLDVSLDTVNVCIVNDAGDVLLERKIEAEPAVIADLLARFGHPFKRIPVDCDRKAPVLISSSARLGNASRQMGRGWRRAMGKRKLLKAQDRRKLFDVPATRTT